MSTELLLLYIMTSMIIILCCEPLSCLNSLLLVIPVDWLFCVSTTEFLCQYMEGWRDWAIISNVLDIIAICVAYQCAIIPHITLMD